MLDAELLTLGLKFHGHKCPAMPMGLLFATLTLRPERGSECAPSTVPACGMKQTSMAPLMK